MTALLTGRAISRRYLLPRTSLRGPAPVREALVGVDIDIDEHETVAIIGESGSGKSTLVRILLGLDAATSGQVRFGGREVTPGPASRTRWLRRETGIVLQDPYASLDPRRTVGHAVGQPLRALRVPGDHDRQVAQVLERVGLHAWRARQYPHELSGGQRQRVALARAIVHGPRLLVGDEPLSALDVTIRAQVLDLLRELHEERGMGVVLVSHDIGLVQHLAARVHVLHDGRVVEHGPAETVLTAPAAAYTRELLAAVPRIPAPTP
ncbi:ABC transporter ATP-binding protein [Cellulomonas soli]|uniref:ABC transporter ATP-binding protein n=1 Tax=Cellulomonas soli TaxID=931535 RepID=A0A512PA31_9CELL|nr:ABC transporter ATP-binding protein [Cellulomonas soli]NYI60544.1 peptide/nickel transport system ATP-binding protein [Cellulomonas soli]GEP68059.1 ABC transporter ATP-binding protein [Cellulomonas soli]